jgi:hypothetical protein
VHTTSRPSGSFDPRTRRLTCILFAMASVASAGSACNLVEPVAECKVGETSGDDHFAPSVAQRQSLRGRNGTYTDHCDDVGNLIDYACAYQAGEVVARAIDCNGNCVDGACPGTCPGLGDVITYLAVDGTSAMLRNETRREDYACALVAATIYGSLESCRDVPRPGDQTEIEGLGLFYVQDLGLLCTGTLGNIGLRNQCSYRCSQAPGEPTPAHGCPQPGSLLTYLEVDDGRTFLQDAGSGGVLECRGLGRCDAEVGDGALLTRVHGRPTDCTRGRFGPIEVVGLEPFVPDLLDAPPGLRRAETCRYLCEVPDPAVVPGQPEICEDGVPAATFHSTGQRETTAGDAGSYVDHCDADGDVVEHHCETRAEIDPTTHRLRYFDTGRVGSDAIDCRGYCASGACPSRCPGFFDELRYLSVGGEFARFENQVDGRRYDCELTWDRSNDDFDCAADPGIGDEALIIAMSPANQSATAQCASLLPEFGTALASDPGREVCAYQCEIPAAVPSPLGSRL